MIYIFNSIQTNAIIVHANYMSITRAPFEELCSHSFHGTLKPIEKSLFDAKMDKLSILKIILNGGLTQIHKVQKLLQDFFISPDLNKLINLL